MVRPYCCSSACRSAGWCCPAPPRSGAKAATRCCAGKKPRRQRHRLLAFHPAQQDQDPPPGRGCTALPPAPAPRPTPRRLERSPDRETQMPRQVHPQRPGKCPPERVLQRTHLLEGSMGLSARGLCAQLRCRRSASQRAHQPLARSGSTGDHTGRKRCPQTVAGGCHKPAGAQQVAAEVGQHHPAHPGHTAAGLLTDHCQQPGHDGIGQQITPGDAKQHPGAGSNPANTGSPAKPNSR